MTEAAAPANPAAWPTAKSPTAITDADLGSQRAIRSYLLERFPGLGFLGVEENTGEKRPALTKSHHDWCSHSPTRRASLLVCCLILASFATTAAQATPECPGAPTSRRGMLSGPSPGSVLSQPVRSVSMASAMVRPGAYAVRRPCRYRARNSLSGSASSKRFSACSIS